MEEDQQSHGWLGSGAPGPTNEQPQPAAQSTSRRRWAGAGLVAAGLVAGGVLAGTLGASAASSTSGSPGTVSSYSAGGYARSSGTDIDPAGTHDHGHGLDLSGTVTAVGTSSVTIRTSSGPATYAVTSSSDIDKNGEAQLSNLAVGDAVTFSSTTSKGTATIDKLHAGNEALDHPEGAPRGSATTG